MMIILPVLHFILMDPTTSQDKDEASDLTRGIIAQFPDGLLEKNYIRLDYTQTLPQSPCWAYKRKG